MELPRPQRVALSYAPARAWSATWALLLLDERLAAVLRARREPIAAQLRLAWWRETLERPPAGWPRGEPLLDALRGWRDPSALAGLAAGWEMLLADSLTAAAIAEFADGRGRAFAGLARELGAGHEHQAAVAARIWALADLAAHLSDDAERALTIAQARALRVPPLPRKLRTLAVLAGLGAAALRRGGAPLLRGPLSTLRAWRIGVTGR